MTVKEYNDRPEARVFRLDTECYIIYLGENGSDYKPFLRIGNTPDLPQPIIANTQNIVITDRLTGNPALESANIFDMYLDEIRYLGDPDLVEHFRTFVKKANLHVQAFEEYTGEEESSANASYVYFYTDGNMSVYFGRNKIFNLRDRERRDVHFIERAKRIRSQYIKNQLRYRVEDFRAPGFFVLEKSVNFFQDGKIVVPQLSSRFFASFAEAGIDPDQIQVVFADSLNENLVDLFKRKRSKQDQIVVVTANPELVSSAAELFSVKKQDSLDARIMDFSGQRAELDDMLLERKEGRFVARFKGLDLAVVAGDASLGEGEALLVDPATAEVSLQRGRRGYRLSVLEGTPHTVSAHVPEPSNLFHRYFDSCMPFYSALLPAELSQLVTAIHAAIGELIQGKDGGALKQVDSRLRDLAEPVHPYVRNYLITAESMLRMIHNGEAGLTPVRAAGTAATTLSRIISSAERTESTMSFVGEVAVGAGGLYLFYRPVKASVTPNQVETAQVLGRKITEESDVDRSAFGVERDRLLDLISQLNIPQTRQTPGPVETAAREAEQTVASESGAAAASEEKPAAERRAEKGTAAASAGRKQAAEEGRGGGPGAEPAPSVPAGSFPGGGSSSGGERRRGRWRIPVAAAALVVAVAAILFFLFRGRIGRPAEGIASTGPNSGTSSSGGESSGGSGGSAGGQAQGAEQGGTGGGQSQGGAQGGTAGQSSQGSQSGGAAGTQSTGTAGGTASAGGASGSGGQSGSAGSASSGAAGQGATGTGGQSGAAGGQSAGAASAGSTGGTGQAGPSAGQPGGGATPSAGQAGTAGQTGGAGESLLRVGGIQITIGDLIRLTNRIATTNGYRPMGSESSQLGPDPHWIYPGNILTLPDGTTHMVVKGDTIWYLAADYIHRKLVSALERYKELLAEYGVVDKVRPSDPQKRQELISRLKSLEEGVYSENFTRMIRGMIVELEA